MKSNLWYIIKFPKTSLRFEQVATILSNLFFGDVKPFYIERQNEIVVIDSESIISSQFKISLTHHVKFLKTKSYIGRLGVERMLDNLADEHPDLIIRMLDASDFLYLEWFEYGRLEEINDDD